MNYESFKQYITDELRERLSEGMYLREHTVRRLNGKGRDALTVVMRDERICPTVYPDSLYSMYEDGTDADEIVDMISEETGSAECRLKLNGEELGIFEKISDFESVKDNICCRIINREKNKDMLKEVPYAEFLDLAVVFYIFFPGREAYYQTMVSNALLELWGIGKEDIISRAALNTKRLNPPKVGKITELIGLCTEGGDFEGDGDVPDITVVTSKSGVGGAVFMLDKDILKEAAEEYGDDLRIVPSSIHEVLLCPAKRTEQAALDGIIREVNESVVGSEEFLSDHSYFYSKRSGYITA